MSWSSSRRWRCSGRSATRSPTASPRQLGPGGLGRDDQSEVVLRHRLRAKAGELNPELPPAALDRRAVEELVLDRSAMDPHARESGRLRTAPRRRQGHRRSTRAAAARPRPCDSSTGATPANNDFLAVSQFWVVGPLHTRRCDIVCFVNGIPLVLLELKASHKTVEQAYRQEPARLPRHDPAAVHPERASSCSRTARRRRSERRSRRGSASASGSGSTTSPSRASSRSRPRSAGCCEPARLLDMVENFVAYLERPGGLVKVLAQNHQVLGVNAAIRALRGPGDAGRAARRLLAHPGIGQEPLDAVLHPEGPASRARQLDLRDGHRPGRARRPALRASSRTRASSRGISRPTSSAHLRRLLGEDHRYVFTLIHKFRPERGRARCRSARSART